jgi:predicted alpha/beta-hydrolase family hydrolase
VHFQSVGQPVAALVLGHGAGGGVTAPDLVAATKAANSAQMSVALVEQPYRVAGRRSPAPAAHLDAAWVAVVEHLRDSELDRLPIITGGRSAGARVACRTAGALAPAAVLCLAFPLHPPGRADDPTKSRLAELDAITVPTLVIQGESDPFGMPPPGPNRFVARIPGNHGLRDAAAVGAAVSEWLRRVLRLVEEPRHSLEASSRSAHSSSASSE